MSDRVRQEKWVRKWGREERVRNRDRETERQREGEGESATNRQTQRVKDSIYFPWCGVWEESVPLIKLNIFSGPENWHKYYPKCKGTRQSPININTTVVKHDSSLGNISFTNYGTVPPGVNFTAKNKGRTVSVSFEGYSSTTVPSISSGGLPGTFKLIGYHFHWGMNSIRGSEHQKDGVRYPAEVKILTNFPGNFC